MPSEYDKLPIPTDWIEETDGYKMFFVCLPNSLGWEVCFKSVVLDLTRGRSWNINTGNIRDTQAIARKVYNSMASCDLQDIVDKLDGLITAIGGISIVQNNDCTPALSVPAFSGAGCPIDELDTPIDEATQELDDPPTGWTEKESFPGGVNEYRCRLSNYMVDYVLAALGRFIVDGVDDIVTFGISAAFVLIVAAYNYILGIFGMAALMTNAGIIAVVRQLFAQNIDLVGLVGIITDNRDDLVCAYYENPTTAAQRDAVREVLLVGGANDAQVTLYELLTPTPFHQFFTYTLPTLVGARVERDIEGHPMTSDCEGCLLECEEYLLFGTEDARVGNELAISSVDASAVCENWVATQRVSFYVNAQVPDDPCQQSNFIYCEPGLTLLSVEVTAGSITQTSNPKLRVWNVSGQKVVSTNSLPWAGEVESTAQIMVLGAVGSAYTVKFTFEEDLP